MPWDLLLVGLGALLLWVLVSGGGVYHLAGVRISIHHLDKLVLVAVLLWWLRWRFTRSWPVFWVRSWTPETLADRLLRGLTAVQGWFDTRRLLTAMLVLAGLAFGLRASLAAIHPGFLIGDDVEVHSMTLRVLWERPGLGWELRNAFYPLVFIMPAQWLVGHDPAGAVLAGRLVVALYGAAGVLLLAVVARRLGASPTVVVLAAALLAISKLAVILGSSVLPRSVAMVWILLAFWCLLRRDGRGVALAAIAVAVATAIRFSEIVFLIPAGIHLALERRWRDLIWFGIIWLIGCAAILGLSDWLYWGKPFSSVVAIVRYTLVDGSSSRGFQPPWYYLTALSGWSSFAAAVLLVVGWRRIRWRPYLWFVAPLVIFSLLPHKEPRYLLPAFPFFCLGVAYGAGDLLRRLTSARAVWLAPLLIALVVLEFDYYDYQRFDCEVRLARFIAAERGEGEGVVFEWGWRAGSWIYLEDVENLDLPGPLEHRPREETLTLIDAGGFTWLALRYNTVERKQLGPDLAARGYVEVTPPTPDLCGRYRLYRRPE